MDATTLNGAYQNFKYREGICSDKPGELDKYHVEVYDPWKNEHYMIEYFTGSPQQRKPRKKVQKQIL